MPKTNPIGIRLPPKLNARLTKEASAQGVPKAEIMREALSRYFSIEQRLDQILSELHASDTRHERDQD